jgi:hypothetical protein
MPFGPDGADRVGLDPADPVQADPVGPDSVPPFAALPSRSPTFLLSPALVVAAVVVGVVAVARPLNLPPKNSLPTGRGSIPKSDLAHLRLRARSSVSEAGATSSGALLLAMLLGNRAPRTLRRSGGRLAAFST